MASQAQRRLPRIVDMVGDRIGLDYNLPRREATISYVNQHDRLDIQNLKYSSYSLSESKTKKSEHSNRKGRKTDSAKNPLKLNAKLRRQLYKLAPKEREQMKYTMMRDIHELWLQYCRIVLSNTSDQANVFKLDLHGCKIKCTASRNPTLVGTEGIVVQETKNTFLVIINTDRLITLPKRESLFEFNIDEKRYRIHGCNYLFTVQARSKTKYKQQRSNSVV